MYIFIIFIIYTPNLGSSASVLSLEREQGRFNQVREHLLIQASYLDDVENEIRKQPGFERFQLPPTETELHHLAFDRKIYEYAFDYISSCKI